MPSPGTGEVARLRGTALAGKHAVASVVQAVHASSGVLEVHPLMFFHFFFMFFSRLFNVLSWLFHVVFHVFSFVSWVFMFFSCFCNV